MQTLRQGFLRAGTLRDFVLLAKARIFAVQKTPKLVYLTCVHSAHAPAALRQGLEGRTALFCGGG